MDWLHLLPMFQTSIPELLKGAKATIYSLSGFEVLFVLYPFIDNKEKAKLPIFLGMGYTSLLIFSMTVIVLGYFSLEDLSEVEFSVLAIYKSVSYTFIERLEFYRCSSMDVCYHAEFSLTYVGVNLWSETAI